VLPAALATKSLAAADQVVTGNCTGSDRKIETAGNGGPAWPNGVALPAAAGGSFKVCTRIGAPPVTTTTAVGVGAGPAGGVLPASLSSLIGATPSASTYSPAASSSPVVDSANLSAAPVDASADTAAAAEAQQPTASAALAAVELPLKAPTDDRYHLDRLTTLLLGGLTFLLLRGPARRAIAGLR